MQRRARARLHARRPDQPGLRLGRRRDRLLRHEQAGHPRRGRRRGARRARVPAHGDARAAVPGARRQARRRHRRRVHLDGLLADVGPPGRDRGDARLPPRHEGHARRERGPRGDRGRRHRHLPGRPGRGSSPTRSRQGDRRRVHPDGARRAGRVRPAPPGAGARHGVHHPVRPRPAGHRPGPGARLARQPGNEGPEATKQWRLKADAVTFETGRPGRVRHRRRADRRRDGGPGDRRGPARGLRRRRLPQGPGPGRHPDPPDARRAAARVPVDRAVHERGQGAALPDDGARGGGAQPQLHRVRAAVHAARRPSPSRPAACSAPARRSGSATCAASGIEYGTTLQTLEPQYHQGAGYRSVTENRFTGVNHDYIRDDSPRVHPARAVALHRLRPLRPTSAPRSSAPRATTSCASASTRWSRRRST